MKTFLAWALLFTSPSLMAFDHNHKLFDTILKKRVSFTGQQSYVDYKGIKSDPKDLNTYLASLSAVKNKDFKKWNAGQRLAFLINSYNAFTLKLIIDNYPVKSIKDIKNDSWNPLNKSPWKIAFIDFLGKKVNLDNIEHDMIRKDFDEPRIHFAVVCASIGCPPLQKYAFKASIMEKQFKDSTKTFLMDKDKNSVDIKNKKIALSNIFKWYGDDFKKKYGSYLKFVSKRITDDPKAQKLIAAGKFDQSWKDYSWKLNER